jgi:hypothetical protein
MLRVIDVVRDADERPRQLLARERLLHDRLGDIDRNGEAYPLRRLSFRRGDRRSRGRFRRRADRHCCRG